MNKITRKDIVEEARTWLGTPFRSQFREKGVGCDCVGLILGVAWAFNFTEFDCNNYLANAVNSDQMVFTANSMCKSVSKDQMDIADIVLISFGPQPTHMGIITDYRDNLFGIIHAMSMMKEVKEHRLSSDWRNKIVRVYQFPGIID